MPGNSSLEEMPLGDSDWLQVCDFVLATGNPFGLGQTVTSGIVSALGRSCIGRNGGYEDFIPTDASINPGNSGSALVDLNGRLVGINTAILSSTGSSVGIGFAVPINMARAVMDHIVRNGSVQRGRIVVSIRDLTPELSQSLSLDRTDGAVMVSTDQVARRRGPGSEPTTWSSRSMKSRYEIHPSFGTRSASLRLAAAWSSRSSGTEGVKPSRSRWRPSDTRDRHVPVWGLKNGGPS